jgi:glycosyltransferase involved in cell wall biosynthesis
VVALERINASDVLNNGMLLRNLFAGWPRECLAQIYSSGDTGDQGFFGYYYKLGPQDRRLGRLFYRLKPKVLNNTTKIAKACEDTAVHANPIASWSKRFLVDTGLYEVIFTPHVSTEMLEWVEQFHPDIIFAQGYNLTFAYLPVLLKEATCARMAFFCSDDWPTYLYSGLRGEPRLFRRFIYPLVRKAASRLIAESDVLFAFGIPMADEYEDRYHRTFKVLYHADDPRRFDSAQPIRVHPEGIYTILVAGAFNRFRWPLLLDADECCRLLNDQGIHARVAVLSSAIDPDGASQLANAAFIDIFDDPGNEKLPSYLKGADLLLLIEAFDEGFVSAIRLSISSKAHLFMFSQRPIVVYANSDTGIAKYASKYRWARVISRRGCQYLSEAIREVLTHSDKAKALVVRAAETAKTFHLDEANQDCIFTGISNVIKQHHDTCSSDK